MCLTRICLVVFSVGLWVSATFADRPHQGRQDATVVVTGYVRAVYSRESEYNRHYVVELFIDQVEKGAGFKSGDTFSVVCYQPKPPNGKETKEELQERSLNVDGGHKHVPAEGDQVRVFAKHFNGTLYEGIFPDWVEVTKKAEPTPQTGPGKSERAAESPGQTSPWLWAAGGLVVGLAGGFAAAQVRRPAGAKRA